MCRACPSSLECHAVAELEAGTVYISIYKMQVQIGTVLSHAEGFGNPAVFSLVLLCDLLRLASVEANVFHYSTAASACEKSLA